MKACSIPDPTKDQLKIMVEMLRASTVEEEEEE
jgi:hypothetical protein